MRAAAVAAVLLLALGLLAGAVSTLEEARRGMRIERSVVAGTPVTVVRRDGSPAGPAVVVAHGFAGSQQLMQPFALALARAGFVAVTYDLLGHGRNETPLGGSLTETTGATERLVAELSAVAAHARSLGDGRLAVLGHSMASDIVVRFAQRSPDVIGTVVVSMFSPAVTATEPRNLLMITGGWEGGLRAEAVRVLRLSAGADAVEDRTYGTFETGTARRAAVSPSVEHVGVLYSTSSLSEAVRWLGAAAGRATDSPAMPALGLPVLVLLGGLCMLAWPLVQMLPRSPAPPLPGLPWARLWPVVIGPAIAGPLLLRVLPTSFLPVAVADYLAAHFAMMGLMTFGALWWIGRPAGPRPSLALTAGALLVTGLLLLAFVVALDRYVLSFWPGPSRLVIVAALLCGTLLYTAADEWATRGDGSARWAPAATKIAFLLSLVVAVALDFERLFFLLIIVPVLVPVLLVFGLMSHWAWRRTRHPLPGAVLTAVFFAWAVGVTFPLLPS